MNISICQKEKQKMLVLFLSDHSCLMYQVLRWCLTVRAQLNNTVSFPVPVHLFPLSECLCSAFRHTELEKFGRLWTGVVRLASCTL